MSNYFLYNTIKNGQYMDIRSLLRHIFVSFNEVITEAETFSEDYIEPDYNFVRDKQIWYLDESIESLQNEISQQKLKLTQLQNANKEEREKLLKERIEELEKAKEDYERSQEKNLSYIDELFTQLATWQCPEDCESIKTVAYEMMSSAHKEFIKPYPFVKGLENLKAQGADSFCRRLIDTITDLINCLEKDLKETQIKRELIANSNTVERFFDSLNTIKG